MFPLYTEIKSVNPDLNLVDRLLGNYFCGLSYGILFVAKHAAQPCTMINVELGL